MLSRITTAVLTFIHAVANFYLDIIENITFRCGSDQEMFYTRGSVFRYLYGLGMC